MEEILKQSCAAVGRPGSEAPFVELFRANWIESLEDYIAYHENEALAGKVPLKLHVELVARARARGIAVLRDSRAAVEVS